jgi:hypothetical protein
MALALAAGPSRTLVNAVRSAAAAVKSGSIRLSGRAHGFRRACGTMGISRQENDMHWVRTLAVLGMVSVAIPGCVGEPPGDPGVRYVAAISAPSDSFVVTVDGVPLASDPSAGIVEYDDYEAALEAPLLRIETWLGEEIVDAIDIGIGACEEDCVSLRNCVPQDLVEEVAPVEVSADGVFLGWGETVRSWRGTGCLRCTYKDGSGFAHCT